MRVRWKKSAFVGVTALILFSFLLLFNLRSSFYPALFHGTNKCTPVRKASPTTQACSSLDSQTFQRLMETRKDLLNEQCQLSADKGNNKVRELFYFDKVGHNGLIWCPVFKAASSSTNFHFCPLYYKDCNNTGAEIWRKPKFNKRALMPKKGTPTLLIVRHPLERMLSAYRDKIQAPGDSEFMKAAMEKISANHRFIPPYQFQSRTSLLRSAISTAQHYLKERPLRRGESVYLSNSSNPYLNPISATFEEFVRSTLLEQFLDVHWLQASHYCAPCFQHYEFILKVEDYQCEFKHLLRSLNSSAEHLQRVASAKRINENEGRLGSSRDDPNEGCSSRADLYEYYAQLPDNLLDALHEWYRADCELFGYDCERFLCEVRQWRREHLM